MVLVQCMSHRAIVNLLQPASTQCDVVVLYAEEDDHLATGEEIVVPDMHARKKIMSDKVKKTQTLYFPQP